jgi:hypothetical protein
MDVAGEGLTGNARQLLFFPFQPTDSPIKRKRALEHVMMQVLLVEEKGYDLGEYCCIGHDLAGARGHGEALTLGFCNACGTQNRCELRYMSNRRDEYRINERGRGGHGYIC